VAWNWRRLLCTGLAVSADAAAAAGPAAGYASVPRSAAAQGYVPAQFIAKQYTEGLGGYRIRPAGGAR
jgi:hypothetical protein